MVGWCGGVVEYSVMAVVKCGHQVTTDRFTLRLATKSSADRTFKIWWIIGRWRGWSRGAGGREVGGLGSGWGGRVMSAGKPGHTVRQVVGKSSQPAAHHNTLTWRCAGQGTPANTFLTGLDWQRTLRSPSLHTHPGTMSRFLLSITWYIFNKLSLLLIHFLLTLR